MKISFKDLSFKKTLHSLLKIFLVIFGTFIVSFASAVFLVPFKIVSGGLTGLGIILTRVIPIDIDIIVLALTWIIFFIGLIFLGLKFSLNTLISSIFYPLFLSLILRTSIADSIVTLLIGDDIIASEGVIALEESLEALSSGKLIIIGAVGGALVGIGCGITFIGGGSTGGLDVLCFILNKFTGLKTSTASLLFDGSIVVINLIIHAVNKSSFGFISSLVGIFAAFLCSMMIDFVYVKQRGAYFADVITAKSQEIRDKVVNELDRSVTIYNVKGGYSEEGKICVRIVFSRNELIKVKDLVASVDKNAFMIISECSTVNGEGFTPLKSSKDNSIKHIKKFSKKLKKQKNKEENTDLDNDK